MFGIFIRRRRKALKAQPVPDTWRGILRRGCPLFWRLPDVERVELLGHMQVFLAEKNFEGCRGQEITEEVKVVIAANACLLLLHRDTDYFARMGSVLVYPTAYLTRHTFRDDRGLEEEVEQVNVGEAWERGSVILSWEDVQLDAEDPDDGFNVVLHEFAHQLDMEDGVADGVPVLEVRGGRARRAAYARWLAVMKQEFEALNRYADWLEEHTPDDQDDDRTALEAFDDMRQRPRDACTALGEEGPLHILDPYGAEDPAEFFAVATEAFFEDATALKQHHSALYAELAAYYRQDPAAWSVNGGRE